MTDELIYILRIIYAVVLGFIIGFERKMRYKEAGIRTHSIVCAGSALIMIVSKYAFADSASFDASRIASQVISGIGFIGAGIIVYRKQTIHGLTTAAGVWATAGVGLAAGAGMYIVAAGATVVLVIAQCVFHIRSRVFNHKVYVQIKIAFEDPLGENADKVLKIFGVEKFNEVNAKRENDTINCTGTILTDKAFTNADICKILSENDFLLDIMQYDEDELKL